MNIREIFKNKKMFKKIKKRHGSNLHLIEFFEYNNKQLGTGGYLVDIQKQDGNIETEQDLSLIVKDKKQVLLINEKIISDDELKKLKFQFSNKDF